MADAQATRFAFEVLGTAPESGQVTRQGVQVAFNEPGPNAAANARTTRFGVEVLASAVEAVLTTRQGVQVAFNEPGANSAANARATRFGLEVLGEGPSSATVTRQGVQAAFNVPGPNSAANARTTRFGVEVLATSFIPMTEFSIPANFELFLHNWVKKSALESAYDTDISAAAESLSEERTGKLQKPYRALTCQWEVKGNDEANEFIVEMRRLVDETSIIPLYPDVVELSQDASALDTTIYGDFTKGRYFQNGPAVLVRLHATAQPNGATRIASWEFVTTNARFDDRIEIQTGLVAGASAGLTFLMPLMQVHPQTSLKLEMATNNVIRLTATFDEIYGPSALPPIASDLPGGFDSYLDIPILHTVPQWGRGLNIEFRREGAQDRIGRGRVVYQRGARHRVVQALQFDEDRDGAWDIINFFDARRGRLRPFWLLDPENVFTTASIAGSFYNVTPLGSLTDFQNEMDYMGVIFSDGTAAVREATVIQLVSGSWRITMDSALPAGYTAADVVSFGRARLCRMENDALSEQWTTSNLCEMNVPVIELLAEGEVTT